MWFSLGGGSIQIHHQQNVNELMCTLVQVMIWITTAEIQAGQLDTCTAVLPCRWSFYIQHQYLMWHPKKENDKHHTNETILFPFRQYSQTTTQVPISGVNRIIIYVIICNKEQKYISDWQAHKISCTILALLLNVLLKMLAVAVFIYQSGYCTRWRLCLYNACVHISSLQQECCWASAGCMSACNS